MIGRITGILVEKRPPQIVVDVGGVGYELDVLPVAFHERYRQAFGRRIRYEIKWPGEASFMAWCARPDDVIYGKFLAWDEGRSRKHEADIYDMLVFQYLEAEFNQTALPCVQRLESAEVDRDAHKSRASSLPVLQDVEGIKSRK